MDPLSVAASVIGVMGAITATGKGINKLASMRKAPSEVLALSNEIEALRAVILLVQTSLSEIHGSAIYQDNKTALSMLLKAAEESVLDLEKTIEYQLKGVAYDDQGVGLKVSKYAWLKAVPEIDRLREKIKNARSNLTAGLTALNLQIGETLRRNAVEIQSITTSNQDKVHEIHDFGPFLALFEEVLERQQIAFRDLAAKIEPLNEQNCSEVSNDTDQHGEASHIPKETNGVSTEWLSNPSGRHSEMVQRYSTSASDSTQDIVRIDATIRIRPCPRFCKCQCHTSSYVKTPRWLRSTLGQLMFSYTNFIRTKPCNYPPCRGAPSRARFTYLFPGWLTTRALSVSRIADNVSGSTASWTSSVPVVIPSTHRMWEAIHHKNLALLQSLFASRTATPISIDEHGNAPLHLAVAKHHPGIYDFLLQQGATEDVENETRDTPASLMLWYGRTEYWHYDETAVAESLCFTPLHRAVALQSRSIDLSDDVLDQYHTHINTPDRLGLTPMNWACWRGDLDAVRLLLKWKADDTSGIPDGRSALHDACVRTRIDCVTLLLNAGWEVDVRDNENATPLYTFANGYVEKGKPHAAMVDLLVRHGADVNCVNIFGITPLHAAVRRGHLAIVNALLRHGANPNVRDIDGRLPVDFAIEESRGSCIKAVAYALRPRRISQLPHPYRTKIGRLHIAALKCSSKALRQMAEIDLVGSDPNEKDNDGDTPTKCFYLYRERLYSAVRKRFVVEERAWKTLMTSVCQQNGLDPTTMQVEYDKWSQVVNKDSDGDTYTAIGEENDADIFEDALEDIES